MADKRGSVGKLFSRITDYLFPALCIVCDSPRPPEHPWFCGSCLARLRENHERRVPCPACAMNRAYGPCACSHGTAPAEPVFSVYDYDTTMRAIIQQVKYTGKKHLVYDLGAIGATLLPGGYLDDIDAIIPVPLYPSHERRRGYNQALWLARGFSLAHPSIPVLDGILARIRNTPTQTNLDKSERLKNMAGAFAVKHVQQGLIKGKQLLLVDDVVTTGATTHAASQALRDTGAAFVKVLSLARD